MPYYESQGTGDQVHFRYDNALDHQFFNGIRCSFAVKVHLMLSI